MTLKQYREALGLNPGQFASAAGVSREIVDRVEDGQVVAASKAELIAAYLTQEYKRAITVKMIEGVKTI